VRVEALQKERSRAVIMKLRPTWSLSACVIAALPVYDLQMQQNGRWWSSVFFGFFQDVKYVGTIGGREGGKGGYNAKLQTAILSDNWNVGLMFRGQLHLSAKRHSSSRTIRVLLQIHGTSDGAKGLRAAVHLNRFFLLEVTKWTCFSLKL